MKPGIFMDVDIQNWRLSIDNGLFVDAVDWIFCLSMKPVIFMEVEVRNWRSSIENGLFVDAVDWIKQRFYWPTSYRFGTRLNPVGNSE